MAHVADLPAVATEAILDLLPPRDRAAACCVCRQWRALAVAPAYWRSACQGTWKRWSTQWDGIEVAIDVSRWSRAYASRVAVRQLGAG